MGLPIAALISVFVFSPFGASVFSAPAFDSAGYETVLIPKTKTSIYVGSVTFTMTPFVRSEGQVYTAEYKASVVPFFFFSESGRLSINFTDEQLARLERGERVDFTGDGKNKKNKGRRILGHAQAEAPGARTGKIKVRVFVTKNTDLVLDTTYTFAEKKETEAGMPEA
ncbi:hypothetical protein CKA38_11510 [Ereboglobus luteus]|uniref:DUF5666 domain-containing protein n=2 Tax=Ereboglobus luteus TaxID=1796921 RepID=A0A2U8E5J3_9BACT|nr:hypothetical protein CKA38_11510 [Ereboglobus luteus]